MFPMVLNRVVCFLQYFSQFTLDKLLPELVAVVGTLTLLVPMHMLMIWQSWPPLYLLSDGCWDAASLLPPCMVWSSTHQVFSSCCRFIYTSQYKLLRFSNTVVHLGNIVSSDLNDSEDTLSKCRDMPMLLSQSWSRYSHQAISVLLSFSSWFCFMEYLLKI